MEKKDLKISKESAQAQIDLLLDSGVVDLEDITSETVRDALESSINVLRKGICKGLLQITFDEETGDLKITQHLTRVHDKTLCYKEIDGQAKMIMGKVSDDNQYERLYTLLGYLSGYGADAIAKLKGVDLSIAECLGAVFLGI